MGERDRGAIVQGLERLLSRGVDPTRDGNLLERFHSGRDEAAFEALVTRHGPMVRGVCRRLLRDPNDADDAFQATFLVLARKAAGLRDPDRLGPWLYGVASRVAARARVRSSRGRARPLTDDLPAREDPRAEWSDVLLILDAELARLPSSQRDVLVACLLNGTSEQEAARAFACPVGTIKSRLSRAREALRTRLVRRGIAPAAALAAASSPGSFASPVSAPLFRATLSLISARAAIPPAVAALTSGVAPIMLSRILVPAAVLAGGLALVGLSATAWTADPPPTQSVSGRAPRVPSESSRQLDRNLKLILLAVHNYISTNDCFPPAASRSPDGRPLLSWRVALLPYLEQSALYNQFHLDEPWDSPHNRQLVDLMPAVFDTPGFPAPRGKTRFRGVDAPGAMFGPPPGGARRRPGEEAEGMMGMMMGGMGMAGEMRGAPGMMGGMMAMGGEMSGEPPRGSARRLPPGGRAGMATGKADEPPAAEGASMVGGGAAQKPSEKGDEHVDVGVKIADITDGTSNTALVLVAEDAVEWTRPGELEIPGGLAIGGGGSALPALVEDGPDGYILGLTDGSVRRLPNQPNRREAFLPALLTFAGGEVVDHGMFAPSPHAVAAAQPAERTPTPAPAPSAASSSAPSLDRRLRRVEEKLDEILDRLDAMAAPASPGP